MGGDVTTQCSEAITGAYQQTTLDTSSWSDSRQFDADAYNQFDDARPPFDGPNEEYDEVSSLQLDFDASGMFAIGEAWDDSSGENLHYTAVAPMMRTPAEFTQVCWVDKRSATWHIATSTSSCKLSVEHQWGSDAYWKRRSQQSCWELNGTEDDDDFGFMYQPHEMVWKFECPAQNPPEILCTMYHYETTYNIDFNELTCTSFKNALGLRDLSDLIVFELLYMLLGKDESCLEWFVQNNLDWSTERHIKDLHRIPQAAKDLPKWSQTPDLRAYHPPQDHTGFHDPAFAKVTLALQQLALRASTDTSLEPCVRLRQWCSTHHQVLSGAVYQVAPSFCDDWTRKGGVTYELAAGVMQNALIMPDANFEDLYV